MKVGIKKLHPDAVIPKYSKPGDAGLDLTAVEVINDESFQVTYRTGLAMEIPLGYVGLLFPRSSIRNYELNLSNSVGVIDCVPAGTKIQTTNGPVLVEEIFKMSSLNSIYSFNEEFNSIEEDYITDMWIVDNLELLEITTEDNTSIKIPLEKEVYTAFGWKRAKELTLDDTILSF
jgi:hypothetical protein